MADRTDHSCSEHDDATAVERQGSDSADPDTFLAERRAELQADAPPVIPPCPSWCVSTAALHPLDFESGDGVYTRTHEAFSGSLVNVEATERSDGHGGPVSLSEPVIRLHGADYDGSTVTPAEMFVLVAEMQRARAVLDELTALTVVPPCPAWCRDDHADGLSSPMTRNVSYMTCATGDLLFPAADPPTSFRSAPMTTTDDRTCPSWCTDCEADRDGQRIHRSATMNLPGMDAVDGNDVATVYAMSWVGYGEHDGLLFRVDMDHVLTPAEMRQAAAALLNFVEDCERAGPPIKAADDL